MNSAASLQRLSEVRLPTSRAMRRTRGSGRRALQVRDDVLGMPRVTSPQRQHAILGRAACERDEECDATALADDCPGG